MSSMSLGDEAIRVLAAGLNRRLPEENLVYMSRREATGLAIAAGMSSVDVEFDGFHPQSRAARNKVSMNQLWFDDIESVIRGNRPLPCGFLSQDEMTFDPPLSNFDECKVIVSTVVFNAYDDLKEAYPSILKHLLCNIAFVDQKTMDHIKTLDEWDGVKYQGWDVVLITTQPYESPLKANRVVKLLLPRLFPAARYSMYIDSSRQLRAEPAALLYHLLIKQGAAMSTPAHYSRQRQWDEYKALARLKGDQFSANKLLSQQTTYRALGFNDDYTGLITGCLILRDHLALSTKLTSCAWFNEVMTYEPRDQVSYEYTLNRLGFHPCATSGEFGVMDRAERYARRHMKYDIVNPQLNSKFYVFEYCQLALVTNFHDHLKEGGTWRSREYYQQERDREH